MVVERGIDFAGPVEIAEPDVWACEWCPSDGARPHRGAYLCAGCIAELDARGSEPRFHLSAADLDAIADAVPLEPGDDHEDEADRWEGDE